MGLRPPDFPILIKCRVCGCRFNDQEGECPMCGWKINYIGKLEHGGM